MSARLPFAEAKALDGATVLATLGVKRAREKRKHHCIACDSSNALHGFPRGGVKCWSCGRSWSNIDAVTHVRHLDARGACAWLANEFAIASSASEPTRAAVTRRADSMSAAPCSQWTALSRVRADGMIPATPPAIYAELVEGLTLGPIARLYLDGRAIDADGAQALGLFSIEQMRAYAAICGRLRESFTFAELAAAGCGVFDWYHERLARVRGESSRAFAEDGACGVARLAYRADVPVLGIAYRHRGEVVSVRFRSLDATTLPKYRSLTNAPLLRVPYNADALDGCAGNDVHVTEGELDALTLALRGHRSIGLPGTGVTARMRRNCAAAVADAARVVIWVDNDAPGREAAGKIWDVLMSTHGALWMRRVQMLKPRHVKDVNALATAGAL